MVSYYNSSNMYRHQQAVAAPANPAPMHSWYAGYQAAQMWPPESQLGEPQMWHSHHPVFPNGEYPEYVHNVVHNEGQLMPSPPITVGSEMSSPGGGAAATGNVSPHQQQARPPPARSPYEWIKKTNYQLQPNPELENRQRSTQIFPFDQNGVQDATGENWSPSGEGTEEKTKNKTRTRDKYRVVYTEFQKLELEKEFSLRNKYITIERKSKLSEMLGLSERQVKIWFQNRRAKERKSVKKQKETQNIENYIRDKRNSNQREQFCDFRSPCMMKNEPAINNNFVKVETFSPDLN